MIVISMNGDIIRQINTLGSSGDYQEEGENNNIKFNPHPSRENNN